MKPSKSQVDAAAKALTRKVVEFLSHLDRWQGWRGEAEACLSAAARVRAGRAARRVGRGGQAEVKSPTTAQREKARRIVDYLYGFVPLNRKAVRKVARIIAEPEPAAPHVPGSCLMCRPPKSS